MGRLMWRLPGEPPVERRPPHLRESTLPSRIETGEEKEARKLAAKTVWESCSWLKTAAVRPRCAKYTHAAAT